jgi:Domain of unknown function (DUF4394)
MRKLIAAAVVAASTLAPMAVWSEMSGAAADRRDDTCGTSRSRELEVVGLTGRRLVCFEAERPQRVRDIGRIRGLQVDTRLVGIDFRPATGDLYGLGDAGGVYTIDLDTARARLASRATVALQGQSFGVDFNPAADRLRVVSDTGQNLRINVVDGTTVADGSLNYTPGTPATGVVGAGYTNNDADTNTNTTLFDVDSSLDQVAIQSPPNNGSLAPTGTLSCVAKIGPNAGFDIFSDLDGTGRTMSNTGYSAFTTTSGSSTVYSLYTVDPLTANCAKVGDFPLDITDVAVALDTN